MKINIDACLKIAKRWGPVAIAGVVGFMGGISDMKAEDRLKNMEQCIADLQKKVGESK